MFNLDNTCFSILILKKASNLWQDIWGSKMLKEKKDDSEEILEDKGKEYVR